MRARVLMKTTPTSTAYSIIEKSETWVFYSIYLLLVGHEGQGCKNRAPWWQTKNTSLEQTMCVYRERSENKNQSKQLSKRGNCTCTDWDEKLDNVKEMNGSARRRTILFHFCFLQSNPSPPPCLFPHLFSLIPYHSSPIPHCNPIPYPHPSFSIRCTLSSIPIRYPLSPFPLFPILLSSIPFPLFPIPYPLSPVPYPQSILSPIPFPYLPFLDPFPLSHYFLSPTP